MEAKYEHTNKEVKILNIQTSDHFIFSSWKWGGNRTHGYQLQYHC